VNREPWTEQDDCDLRTLWGWLPPRLVAESLGRTTSSIGQHARKIGLPPLHAKFAPATKEAIRRLHGDGLLDSEIARRLDLDRRSVSACRAKRLKLPVNAEAVLRVQRENVEKQRRSLGIRHGGDLRTLGFRRFAIERGWPENLQPRAVQILEALAVAGRPMNRWELATIIGQDVERIRETRLGQRKLLKSNGRGGNYVAELMRAGLVICLGRVQSTGARRRGNTRCLYMLSPAAINIVIARSQCGGGPKCG
jgi:hypothetical protein